MYGLLPLVLISILSEAPPSPFSELSRQANQARDAKRLDEATGLYQKALRLDPSWEDGWWSLGSIAYDSDNYAECAAAFQKLAQLKAGSAPAWTMRGLCEYKLRDFSAAWESLKRAEALHYEEPHELGRSTRLHLALLATKSGRFEKAIVTLTELTRFDRKSPEITVAAGIAGLRESWLPFEVPEAQRPLVLKLGEAMATAMEQDVPGAITKFEDAAKAFPSDARVHYRFGAFLAMQDPERGIAEIQTAIKLDPTLVPALVGLTAIYLKREDLPAALKYAKRGVEAGPKDFATHLEYGRVLLASQSVPAAAKELERAVELSPETPEARYNLATAYSRLGRKQDAQREQQEFKRLTGLVSPVRAPESR